MILSEMFFETVNQIPNKICMQIKEQGHWSQLTYADVQQKIINAAHILQTIGIQLGDRILLLTENHPDAMIAFLAIGSAKATAVLIDPNLPEIELRKLIAQVDASALLISKKCFTKLPSTLALMMPVLNIQNNLSPCENYPTVIANPLRSNTDKDEEVAAIFFTSGTTGYYKGALLTHANLQAVIENCKNSAYITQQDHMLSLLPSHHIAGIIQNLTALYVGTKLTFVEKVEGPALLAVLAETQPTVMVVVPLLLEFFLNKIQDSLAKQSKIVRIMSLLFLFFSRTIRLLTSRNIGFYLFHKIQHVFGGKLTRLLSGGAPNKKTVLNTLEDFGFTILDGYGLTETTGPVCTNHLHKKKLGTAGIAFPNINIRLINCNEKGEGELCIQGPSVMKGYFRDPIATQQALSEGWFRTGDLGTIDKQGFITITGRTKEIIVLASGKKVAPIAIEKHYQGIDGVAELAIFGMPDDIHGGDHIHAAIVLNDTLKNALANKEKILIDIQATIQEQVFQRAARLPITAQIQRVHIVDALPKTAILKVKRTALPALIKESDRIKQKLPITEHNQPSVIPHAEISGSQKINSIKKIITQWIASKTNLPLEEIQELQSFVYYGLDSLNIIELCETLKEALQITINPAVIWEHPSIGQLAAYLANEQSAIASANDNTSKSAQTVSSENDPIAIIGMGCRFPGDITNPEAYWKLLLDGRDGIAEIPEDRWNREAYRDSFPQFGGFIKGVDQFDAEFFDIWAAEAKRMDPQHRLLLEVTWEALENANMNPEKIAGTRTGVYVGISSNDYTMLQIQATNPADITPYYGIGSSASAAPGRIAYFFDLHGPCKAIDTACSSSLVAVHDACEDLRRGHSSLAIVGGVNLLLSPLPNICFSKSHMLSADGYCKVFDAAADGYVRAEGCGVLVLKRLSEAKRDGDTILATIKASVVNQDGRSNGITAPNGSAQIQLLQDALARANLTPNQIDYIELHGTGTRLGDPIEVRSIAAVHENASRTHPLYLGAVKANLGHLEAAAGVAGIIKVILSLQHRYIPKQVHFRKLNPLIQPDKIPAIIPDAPIPWPSTGSPGTAGISSFSFTGTNVHIILNEAPPSTLSTPGDASIERSWHLLTLSARSKEALDNLILRYQDYLAEHPHAALADICYTTHVARVHFHHRLTLVASDLFELRERLLHKKYNVSQIKAGTVAPRIAFIFTGEGAQYPEMCREFYLTQPLFKATIDRCAEILNKEKWDHDIREIFFNTASSNKLNQPLYIQPALFAIEYAMAQLWIQCGVHPACMVGDDLGEYVAATLAGIFTLEDGLKLIVARARLMNTSPENGALAKPMLDTFRQIANTITYHLPKIPVISNVTGEALQQNQLNAEYWVTHTCCTANFENAIQRLDQSDCSIYLAIGTLRPLVNQEQTRETIQWLPSINSGSSDWETFFESLGQLYLKGVEIDWLGLEAPYATHRRKINLPTYPFIKQRHWIKQASAKKITVMAE